MEPDGCASIGVRARHTNVCSRFLYPVNNVHRSTTAVPAIEGTALASQKSGGGQCAALSYF